LANTPKRFFFHKTDEASAARVFSAQGMTLVRVREYQEIGEIFQQLSFTQLRDNYQQVRSRLAADFETFLKAADRRTAWGALYYARASSEIGLAAECAELQEVVKENAAVRHFIDNTPPLRATYLLVCGRAEKRLGLERHVVAKGNFEQLEQLANDPNPRLVAPLCSLALRYCGIFWMWPPDPSEKDLDRAQRLFEAAAKIADEGGFNDESLDARKFLASLQGERGNRLGAAKTLLAIANEARVSGYRKNEAWSFLSSVEQRIECSGSEQLSSSEIDDQLGYIQEAMRIFRSIGHLQGLGESHFLRARLLRKKLEGAETCRKDAELALAYATIADIKRTRQLASEMIASLRRTEEEVRLCPHNENWPAAFEKIKECLMSVLAQFEPCIEHIGSTSIPGLIAKPTIDVAIGFESLDAARKTIPILESLGYEFVPEFREKTEQALYLVRGPSSFRSEHVYLIAHGSKQWNQYILFRDYLRMHSDSRDEYEKLKIDLARKYPKERPRYTAEKVAFTLSIVNMAAEKNAGN